MAAAVAAPSDRRTKPKNQVVVEETMDEDVKEEAEIHADSQPRSGPPSSAASGEDEASEDIEVEIQDEEEGIEEEEEDDEDEGEDEDEDDPSNESPEDDQDEGEDADSGSPGDQSVGGTSGEGGEVSEEEHEAVGAVKLPQAASRPSDDEEGSESASEEESGGESNGESGGEGENDDGASEEFTSVSAVEDWEDASAGEAEVDVAGRNNCIFCKLGEDDDPSEEFEEYLACAVCGDNAHQQCAREEDSLDPNMHSEGWKCPTCTANHMESPNAQLLQQRRESTASQVPKELLPPLRSSAKPGSHSIFENLIIDDGSIEGARSLRKRKSSSTAPDDHSTASAKRQKRDSRSASSDVASNKPIARPTSKRQSTVTEPEADPPNPSLPRLLVNTSQGASTRPRRQRTEPTKVRTLIKEGSRFLIAIKVDLSRIKQKPPKKVRQPSLQSPTHARFSHIPTTYYATPFYSLHGQETDESKKPYGGILTETEADTSKTFPTIDDRARFDDAKQQANEEWNQKIAIQEAELELKGRTSTKISGPPSKIKCINFGGFEIDTWYAAPYPEEYSRNRVLFICEFCLKYMPSDYVAWRHKLKCSAKYPPGDEIYRHKSISVFEVDGRKNPVYCQNLCLLAKLFLGSKTLYYDVEPFLFYIMTEYDELGYHFVGYFSKEKRPSSMNNVSCILTLPIHQRKGYGNLLIDFSYLLTRVEQKTGSPEKPLSDMGLVSYRNYWRLVLARTLLEQREAISITKIADLTGMTPDDIIAALEALRALVRDPVTKTYALRIDRLFLRETIEKWEAKQYVTLNPDALIWTPYIMGRNNLASYDRGAPISTVAPREDEEDNPATSTAVPEEGVQAQIAQEVKAAAAEIVAAHTDLGDATSSISVNHIPNGSTTNNMTPNAEASPAVRAPTIVTMNTASITMYEDESSGPATDNLLGKEKAINDTPKPNGVQVESTSAGASRPPSPQKPGYPIPPARYEIYPPIPGYSRRRTTHRPSTAGTPTGASRSRRLNSPPARLLANGGAATGGAGTPGIVVLGEDYAPSAGTPTGPSGSAPGTPLPRALNGFATALDVSAGPSTGATTPNGRRTRSSMLASKSVEQDDLAHALAGANGDGVTDLMDVGDSAMGSGEGSNRLHKPAAVRSSGSIAVANQAAFERNTALSTTDDGNNDDDMDAEDGDAEDAEGEKDVSANGEGEGLEGRVVVNVPMAV